MPLYEYKCTKCAHRFERIMKFSDEPLRTCPHCGKDALRQLISAPAVQFKGSGWYVTDYAHKSSSTGSSALPPSEHLSETIQAAESKTPENTSPYGRSGRVGAKDNSSAAATSSTGASTASAPSASTGKAASASAD